MLAMCALCGCGLAHCSEACRRRKSLWAIIPRKLVEGGDRVPEVRGTPQRCRLHLEHKSKAAVSTAGYTQCGRRGRGAHALQLCSTTRCRSRPAPLSTANVAERAAVRRHRDGGVLEAKGAISLGRYVRLRVGSSSLAPGHSQH